MEVNQQPESPTPETPADQVRRIASELFNQQPKPDWVTFFRAIFGVDGIMRRLFQSRAALSRFQHAPEHAELMRMLSDLRAIEDESAADSNAEPTRVITVRLPKSLHESLRTEAHDEETSMNQLCITKLLRPAGGADF